MTERATTRGLWASKHAGRNLIKKEIVVIVQEIGPETEVKTEEDKQMEDNR